MFQSVFESDFTETDASYLASPSSLRHRTHERETDEQRTQEHPSNPDFEYLLDLLGGDDGQRESRPAPPAVLPERNADRHSRQGLDWYEPKRVEHREGLSRPPLSPRLTGGNSFESTGDRTIRPSEVGQLQRVLSAPAPHPENLISRGSTHGLRALRREYAPQPLPVEHLDGALRSAHEEIAQLRAKCDSLSNLVSPGYIRHEHTQSSTLPILPSLSDVTGENNATRLRPDVIAHPFEAVQPPVQSSYPDFIAFVDELVWHRSTRKAGSPALPPVDSEANLQALRERLELWERAIRTPLSRY